MSLLVSRIAPGRPWSSRCRPPARHSDLRPVSFRVYELSLPAVRSKQLFINLLERCGEDRLQELVRDLADRLLSGPSVQFLGAAIPVGDDVVHVAHEDPRWQYD